MVRKSAVDFFEDVYIRRRLLVENIGFTIQQRSLNARIHVRERILILKRFERKPISFSLTRVSLFVLFKNL